MTSLCALAPNVALSGLTYSVLSLISLKDRASTESLLRGIRDKTYWTKPLGRIYRLAMEVVKRRACCERGGTEEPWEP